MSPKTVTQSMRRNVGDPCGRRVRLDYFPGILPGHLPATVQKQLGLSFVAQMFSRRQISLQPVNGAATQRNTPLFVALAMTGNQRRIQVNVAGLQAACL